MAIIQTVNNSAFRDAFRDAGRGNQFSYDGLNALYEFLDQLSDDIGETIELDVIALCCDYQELTLAEAIDQYSIDVSETEDLEEQAAIVREYLHDNTSVIEVTDNVEPLKSIVIIQQF